MSKAAKECLDTLINSLCLAIRLQMICRTHPEFNTSYLEKLPPKVASEDLIAIGHQSRGHTMESVHSSEENLGNASGSEWMVKPHEVCILREEINYH